MSKIEKNKLDDAFKIFLIEKGLSKRVACNNLSRLKRIEKDIKVNLNLSISTPENYVKTMILIHVFASKNAKLESVPALAGTLRKALRYFLEFKLGHSALLEYPLAYKFGKRSENKK